MCPTNQKPDAERTAPTEQEASPHVTSQVVGAQGMGLAGRLELFQDVGLTLPLLWVGGERGREDRPQDDRTEPRQPVPGKNMVVRGFRLDEDEPLCRVFDRIQGNPP